MTIKSLHLHVRKTEETVGEGEIIAIHLCDEEDRKIESWMAKELIGIELEVNCIVVTDSKDNEKGLRELVNNILNKYDHYVKVPSYLVKTFTKGTE